MGYSPDGSAITISPGNILDEVWDEDLTAGTKTNPERVFRAVLARQTDAMLSYIADQNTPLPGMPWTETHGVTQLRSAREVVAEGQRMHHCVGGYVDACRKGRCFILRLPDSTVEVSPDGSVYQHRARHNTEPGNADKALLARWLSERRPAPHGAQAKVSHMA